MCLLHVNVEHIGNVCHILLRVVTSDNHMFGVVLFGPLDKMSRYLWYYSTPGLYALVLNCVPF